jgi:hypothetical protein
MPLAITADPTYWRLSGVALAVTGATGGLPVGAPIYSSSFGAGYDGWTGGTDSAVPAPAATGITGTTILPGYAINNWSDETQYLQRTMTGLTIGHVYKVTVRAKVYIGAMTAVTYVGVQGISNGTAVALTSTSYQDLTYTFTATATSHVVRIRRTTGTGCTIQISAITMQRMSTASTEPITIQRVDDNGTHFVRLLENGQTPDASGAFSVTDYEAPFSNVFYVVRDAAGNLAYSAIIDPGLADPVDTLPVRLVAVGRNVVQHLAYIDEYEEGIEYQESSTSLSIIGRPEPVVSTRADNRWSARRGTLRLHCANYDEVQRVLDVYRASRVVFLATDMSTMDRDLMHVASSVTAQPAVQTVNGWTWKVEVEFQEVAWPTGWLNIGANSVTYEDMLDNHLAYFNVPMNRGSYNLVRQYA